MKILDQIGSTDNHKMYFQWKTNNEYQSGAWYGFINNEPVRPGL